MKVKDVKQVNKGSLKLVFSLEFENLGITIRDFKLMDGKNGMWISPPSREYQDSEGKKKYYSYFVVPEDKREVFQKACMDMLKPHLQQSSAQQEEEQNVFW